MRVDRTLLSETRKISGVPCAVTATAHGSKLLFSATSLGEIQPPMGAAGGASASKKRRRGKRGGKDGASDGTSDGEAGLPIPASQLAAPLHVLVDPAHARELLLKSLRVPRAQAGALLQACHRPVLARCLAPTLKIVVKMVPATVRFNSTKHEHTHMRTNKPTK